MCGKYLLPFLVLSIFLFAQVCFADVSTPIQTTRDNIFALIDAGDFTAAESAINKMTVDFADNKLLARKLWEIANRYDKVKACTFSKNLYERITASYPNDIYATYAALQLGKLKIITQIEAGNYDDANLAVEQLMTRFAGHKQLARRLWEIGNKYDKAEVYNFSKNLYKKITLSYPNDVYSSCAALQLEKWKIFEQIDSGNYNDANLATAQIMSKFAGNGQMAQRLLEIANRFDKFGAFGYSKNIYNTIATRYPKDEYATYAGLQLAKLKVYELIDAGDYESADLAVSGMIKDFAGHKQLPRRLHEIARRYEKNGLQAYAIKLHSQIAADWPNDEYGSRSAFKYEMEIDTIVDVNGIAEIKSAIEKLIADYKNNPQLTGGLPETIFHIAEICYEKASIPNIDNESSNKLLNLASELLEKYALEKLLNKHDKASAYYICASINYKLGDIDKTMEYAEKTLQTDPYFEYAANMQWLIADCYEKMKTSGWMTAADANMMIEEAYVNLWTKYSGTNLCDYAALRLGEINLSRGENTKACAYYGWFLQNAEPGDARIAGINKIYERCGRNNNE